MKTRGISSKHWFALLLIAALAHPTTAQELEIGEGSEQLRSQADWILELADHVSLFPMLDPPPPPPPAPGSRPGPAPEAQLPPNELGQVMILEYHKFGPKEDRWERTLEHFEADLLKLAADGYVLMSLNDYIDGRMVYRTNNRIEPIPAHKTPVILTFDDAAPGQFPLKVEQSEFDPPIFEGAPRPTTALGVINMVAKKFPGFGRAGTFFLNPVGRPLEIRPVLQEMIKQGFELGNHTLNHRKLNELSRVQVERETALCQAWIEENIPSETTRDARGNLIDSRSFIRTMALPFGIYPRLNGKQQEEWVRQATWQGDFRDRNIQVRYKHDALLEVGSNPAPSPFSTRLKLMHLPRIQVWGTKAESPGAVKGQLAAPGEPIFDTFFKMFKEHPSLRYVSDGNPSVVSYPSVRDNVLDRDKLTLMNMTWQSY